ncbi:unnamed protein product, partial [Mesorhabditis belari]|uniref:SSD domain-containing protein n=1 Tax=Mesorhabditis belari TaxID=2138241 RepID=A0AAF3EZE6_9BILA
MIVILIIFTPSIIMILTSTAAVLSINLGVFGALPYMGIDLDPISMTTTLMAIESQGDPHLKAYLILLEMEKYLEKITATIERSTHDAFYWIGVRIAHRPRIYLALFTFWSFVMAGGVWRFKEVNNVREHFSATNSPSRYEFAVAREFFQDMGMPFHVVVALQAADKGSILRPGYIEKALEIEDYLQYKLKIEHDNRTWSYSDFCGTQCDTSDAVNIFLTMYRDQQVHKTNNVKLTYPSMDLFGHHIYLANNIFLVDVNKRSQIVEAARLIAINFQSIYPNETMEAVMHKWEHAVFDFTQRTLGDPLIHAYCTSEGLVSEEVRRTGILALPLMPITVLVVFAFTLLTTWKMDPLRSKPWEAILGVLCPILSLFASFGNLFWLGYEFLPIVTVVPFLILAIGVDDVFIFLHAWHRTSVNKPAETRSAEMLADAGPSITIASLTNLLSFGTGILAPTPAITVFCVFISVAVVYDWVYQVFFYTAVLQLSGEREEKRGNAFIPCLTVAQRKKSEMNKKMAEEEEEEGFCHKMGNVILDVWVDFCMSTWSKFLVGASLIVYWAFMINGVLQIRVGLTSEKLFMDDSPLLTLVKFQSEVIFKEGGQATVFVNNPGDLRQPEAIPEIMRLLTRFENANHSVGAVSTHMWLLAYLPYIGLQSHGSIDFQYKYLPDFFKLQEYRRWSHFVSLGDPKDCYEEKAECLHKFVFLTGFRDAVTWADRLSILSEWRVMARQYPHLNLTIYEDFSTYSDQLLSIVPVTQSTVGGALICMIVILIIFTPSIIMILTSTAAVLSINLGVFGALPYMGIDLDPISMTTTLMAIGFSVDYVAHITFHYYKGDFETKRARIEHALTSIAWPMIQAGASTMFAVLVLAKVHAYMVAVFVKVVVLVIILGMIHGLIVLPVLYSALPFSKHKKSKSRMNTPRGSIGNIHSINIRPQSQIPDAEAVAETMKKEKREENDRKERREG